jgi:hypothetical protein
MPRDPLTDPRPGDVVRPTVSKSRERHVAHVWAGNIDYWSPTSAGTPGRRKICWISTWMEWCRRTKAEVVPRAEGSR